MKFRLNKEKNGYILTKGDNEQNVVIPETYMEKPVIEIGYRAFFLCTNLISITIPNSITKIGSSAFNNCHSLKNITIPDSVISIGGGAFWQCYSLTSITIPNSVISIGRWVFWNCDNLTSVTIGNSVTSIGKCAFFGCESLTSIVIPDSVTSIGSYAFEYCSSLTNESPLDINKIKCVKGFDYKNGKLKCRDFVYEVGKTYKEEKAKLCEYGFHACTNGIDVFNYYAGENVKYYEVELEGITDEQEDDSKICGTKITLLRELSVAEAANYRWEEHN